MKLGVVVVTHGQLATELVNSAEMIVGDLPQFAAVSIGWHDDVERRAGGHRAGDRARARPRRHRERAGDVLVLTDMFGGTPANLGDDVRRDRHVEVITGVNLPMLIKLARPPQVARPAGARARDARARAERDLGGVGPAARREERMTSRDA